MNRPSYKELFFGECKDREEQLRWIEDAVTGSAKFYGDPPYRYEEELARKIMQLHIRIAELEGAQRWIPVSERLPEDGKPVWVCTIWNEQHSGFLIDGVWVGLFRDFREGEITHWMPLPEPPSKDFDYPPMKPADGFRATVEDDHAS